MMYLVLLEMLGISLVFSQVPALVLQQAFVGYWMFPFQQYL